MLRTGIIRRHSLKLQDKLSKLHVAHPMDKIFQVCENIGNLQDGQLTI